MEAKLRLYFIGVTWFVLSLISSSINDIITKHVGARLHSYEVTFFRFAFSTLTLLPFILYYGGNTLKTSRPIIHFLRGLLLFMSITGWGYGLTLAPVTTATVVSFTIPIFVLVIGVFLLNENIIWQRWVMTIVAFLGLSVTLNPRVLNPEMLIFVVSAAAFAILDILNKKFVIQESMISMLFYSAIITAMVALPFAMQYWIVPTKRELMLLFALGCSANLILFFILKAFTHTDATALAPYRYLELILSALIAYIIFQETPHRSTIYGALIVIPSTLFVIYSERKEIIRNRQ